MDEDSIIANILNTAPKTDFLTARQLLLQAYQQHFEIFDHLEQSNIEAQTNDIKLKRPLASVALHPAEDMREISVRKNIYLKFGRARLGHHFNISLTEFLNLPYSDIETLFELADLINKEEAAAAAKTLKELKGGEDLTVPEQPRRPSVPK